MRISDWSSDVCSSDLIRCGLGGMDMISGTLRHRGMLFAAASVVAMGLAASPASAQSETAADEGTESEIVVTGFRASLENALKDRKSVGEGKRVSVRVDLGGRRLLKKKQNRRIN